MKVAGVLQTMEGLDASRRVGWAKYYELQEENETLRSLLQDLASSVMFNPRIHSEDPIIELARRALAA